MAFSNPIASPLSGQVYIDALLYGQHWDDPGSANTTRLAVYTAGANDPEAFDFGGRTVTGNTSQAQANAFIAALQAAANVSNLVISTVSNKNAADLIVAGASNADVGTDVLGTSVPPGEDTGPNGAKQGGVLLNNSLLAGPINIGSYAYEILLHELGHALGLKHPHDGGGADNPLFPGVDPDGDPFTEFGDFNLNQGIFTVMSYGDGYPAGPNGPLDPEETPDRGWMGSYGAFDIAVLQRLYGVNTSYHAGNDVYRLPTAEASAFYSCIWDAGGKDTIRNDSSLNSTIDLRMATITRAPGGGGFVSQAVGIDGGFTIAKNAVIENAIGGSARDVLQGNGAANGLFGNAGRDIIRGAAGNDNIVGGGGGDSIDGGNGADRFTFQAITDSGLGAAARDLISNFVDGTDVIALAAIDANIDAAGNQAFAFGGSTAGTLHGVWFSYNANTNQTTIFAGNDGDAAAEMSIALAGNISLTAEDFIL